MWLRQRRKNGTILLFPCLRKPVLSSRSLLNLEIPKLFWCQWPLLLSIMGRLSVGYENYTFFLFCFDFVTCFCHNLNRHASLLRNILTGNQTASFYFKVGISLQPFLATIFLEICIYLEWYTKKQFTCKNLSM